MNASANNQFFDTKSTIVLCYNNLYNELKNLILERAKEKTIYFPLDTITINTTYKDSFKKAYVSKIFLDGKIIETEAYFKDGSGDKFWNISFDSYNETEKRMILDAVNRDVIDNQFSLRCEYKVLKIASERYFYDHQMRCALADNIIDIYKKNKAVLGTEFTLYVRNKYYQETLSFQYCSYNSSLKAKNTISDRFMYLTEYPVEILKQLKIRLFCEIDKQKRNE